MDKIDTKLLRELDIHPRSSTTTLASKVRVSKQVVAYRLNRLMGKTITKLSAIVNLRALGLEHYYLFLTFHGRADKEAIHTLGEYLKEREGVYWVGRCGNAYDLIIVLFVYTFGELDAFMDELDHRFQNMIKDYKIAYGLNYEMYRHKYLSGEKTVLRSGVHDTTKDIDELDFMILAKLQENCRYSAVSISQCTAVSYKTVLNRIAALHKKNVLLGYRLFMRSESYKPFIVLFGYKNYTLVQENKLLAHMRFHDRTTQLVRLFGMWNLAMHVRARDTEELQSMLIEWRSLFPIVDRYEVISVFEDITLHLLPTTFEGYTAARTRLDMGRQQRG